MPESIRTVGDLVARLREFDADTPVKVQSALATHADFILTVGKSPDDPGTIAVIYVETAPGG